MNSSFLRLLAPVFAAGLCVAACGSRASLEDPDYYVDVDGSITPDGSKPKSCGDGKCEANEDCTSCAVDCGLCKTCGDGKCAAPETCSSCEQDCGSCNTCGDGFCKNGEDCLSCAQDCGVCKTCGDGVCDASNSENCFTCAKDCGACMGCGDGSCKVGENCSSCPTDCGVCSVCGNGKCETLESCTNCAADCGQCTSLSCLAAFECSIKCVDLQSQPPTFSVSCIANCLSQGCANTQFFYDQAFSCAVTQGIPKCGGFDFTCLQNVCGTEIAACIGSSCN